MGMLLFALGMHLADALTLVSISYLAPTRVEF